MTYSRTDVAATIDATAIGDTVTVEDVRHLCSAALVHQVRGVCISPGFVEIATSEIAGSGLEIVGVVGFPDGSAPTDEKFAEIESIADAGGYEIDAVMNVGALTGGDTDAARADAERLVVAAHERDLIAKLIVEVGALDEDELAAACEICLDTGADWVKTATGFGPRGTVPGDVTRIRKIVGDDVPVKAAGGIRTWDKAVALLDAGAEALGCSQFVAVLDGAPVAGEGRGYDLPGQGRDGYGHPDEGRR